MGQDMDSMYNELKTAKHDSIRLRLRNEIGHIEGIYRFGYWDSLLSEAKRLKLKAREADALNLIGYIYSNNGDIKNAIKAYSQSLVLREEIGEKSNIANSLNNLGFVYINQGDTTKANKFLKRSIAIQEEIKDTAGLYSSYTNLGIFHHNNGNDKLAIEYFYKCLKLQEGANHKKEMASILTNIGNLFDFQGNIQKSLEYHQKSLKIQLEIKDKDGIAYSLDDIGSIYRRQNENSKALEYHTKALKIWESTRDTKGMAQALNHIGSVYKDKAEYDLAFVNYFKSIKLYELANYKIGVSNVLINIALIYKKQNKLSLALESFQSALKIQEELQYKYGMANSLYGIGDIYFIRNELKEASDYASRCLKISKEIGYPDNLMNASLLLYKINQISNNPAKALEMYKLYITMRDSIKNEGLRKASIKSQFQIEFDAKEKEMQLKAQIEKQLIEQRSIDQRKQKNIIIYSVLSGLLVVILFSVYLFKSLQENKKASSIIAKQKQEVEESKKEIVDSINYAKRIQYALLAGNNLLKSNLPDHFVLFKPKDVVSGDFYWATATHDGFVYITADCTGHGVPGAFMSLLNISKLSQTIIESKITRPDLILNNVRDEIIKALNPYGTAEESKDGMDAVLCKLDIKNMKLEYAAANNAFYIIRNNEILHCRADKMPVGKGHNDSITFTYNEIALQKGDTIYTFTDGYADQFGGEKGKKFKYKQLEELLLSIHQQSLQKQQEILLQKFNTWKGNLEQVDDVCIIGVRV